MSGPFTQVDNTNGRKENVCYNGVREWREYRLGGPWTTAWTPSNRLALRMLSYPLQIGNSSHKRIFSPFSGPYRHFILVFFTTHSDRKRCIEVELYNRLIFHRCFISSTIYHFTTSPHRHTHTLTHTNYMQTHTHTLTYTPHF